MRALVRPLEEGWQACLDAVLRGRGEPATSDVARLGPRLAALSRAYNAGEAGASRDGAKVRAPLDARIAFSFARDVPKGAAAVRELVAAGAFDAHRGGTLRVVDLGAGLGAMTWGLVRALDAAGRAPRLVSALLVDDDDEVLRAASAIAREASSRGLVPQGTTLELKTQRAELTRGMQLPEADVVFVGQVLSELDVDGADEARVDAHAALLDDLLARVVAPGGALVIVEPALRARARHLHALRDRLASRGRAVFAPCLHDAPCPARAMEREWCHDDLAVDLPPWLVGLARAAGLRFQRLTLAYLVLRRDGGRLGELVAAGASSSAFHARVVSELLSSKGKTEVFACTAGGVRARLRLLDRDARDAPELGEAWSRLQRGDVVTLRVIDGPEGEAPVDERGRVGASVGVDVWQARQ